MNDLPQQLINGLSWGAIYALIAVGYTMVYGVLRLINFAHGDVYMVGAMVGLYIGGSNAFTLMSLAQDHPLFWWPVAALAGLLLLVLGVMKLRSVRVPGAMSAAGRVVGALLLAGLVIDLAGRGVGHLHAPSWPAFALTMVGAMIACGALGYVIEIAAYRPLRDQPRISSLITAIGVSMFLEFGGQRAFGATPRAFPQLIPGIEKTPVLFTFGGAVSVTKVDVVIFVLAMLLMLALRHIVLHTRTGLALRAVSFRFDTAALMGIPIDRIISFTFVLGSMLAAAAGVLVAVRSVKIDPLMGLMPGLKAFVAAVLGGIGNIPGAVAGALLLGLTETLVVAYLPQGSQYRDGVAFVILIGILLVKPSGLFGQNVTEKV